jgi:DTW domain-containing protein YfiP
MNNDVVNVEGLTHKVQRILKDKAENQPLKNTITQDFSKGGMRNQKCPECGNKLKRCKCFEVQTRESMMDELM